MKTMIETLSQNKAVQAVKFFDNGGELDVYSLNIAKEKQHSDYQPDTVCYTDEYGHRWENDLLSELPDSVKLIKSTRSRFK